MASSNASASNLVEGQVLKESLMQLQGMYAGDYCVIVDPLDYPLSTYAEVRETVKAQVVSSFDNVWSGSCSCTSSTLTHWRSHANSQDAMPPATDMYYMSDREQLLSCIMDVVEDLQTHE